MWLPLAFLVPLWDVCPFPLSLQAKNVSLLFAGPRVPGSREPHLPESLVFSTLLLVHLDTCGHSQGKVSLLSQTG